MGEIQVLTLIVQGGSFALLAYMAIYGLPRLLREQREEREAAAHECREEREAALSAYRDERERDRHARHEQANAFQTAINASYLVARQEGSENRKALEMQTQQLTAAIQGKAS